MVLEGYVGGDIDPNEREESREDLFGISGADRFSNSGSFLALTLLVGSLFFSQNVYFGRIYRKAMVLGLKTRVSCRFSEPIHGCRHP